MFLLNHLESPFLNPVNASCTMYIVHDCTDLNEILLVGFAVDAVLWMEADDLGSRGCKPGFSLKIELDAVQAIPQLPTIWGRRSPKIIFFSRTTCTGTPNKLVIGVMYELQSELIACRASKISNHNLLSKKLDKLEEEGAEVKCAYCWSADPPRFDAGISLNLPPPPGTKKRTSVSVINVFDSLVSL